MDNYYETDPEAQPFKDSYEETYDTRKKRPRLEWQPSSYDKLSDEDFYARRREMVTDPVIIETVKNLRKLVGDAVANSYFKKYLDNLDKVERIKGHYEIR